jgi:hypothetical protein
MEPAGVLREDDVHLRGDPGEEAKQARVDEGAVAGGDRHAGLRDGPLQDVQPGREAAQRSRSRHGVVDAIVPTRRQLHFTVGRYERSAVNEPVQPPEHVE